MIRYNVRTTDGAIVLVAGESYRWTHGDAGAVFLDIIAAGNVVASFLDPQHVADNNSVYLPKPAAAAESNGSNR